MGKLGDIGIILGLGLIGGILYMFATGKWKLPKFELPKLEIPPVHIPTPWSAYERAVSLEEKIRRMQEKGLIPTPPREPTPEELAKARATFVAPTVTGTFMMGEHRVPLYSAPSWKRITAERRSW